MVWASAKVAAARCLEIASAAVPIAILVANDAPPCSKESMDWASFSIMQRQP
jgi:hypothetical protein